jgi:uncharacterized protein with HEPN domain
MIASIENIERYAAQGRDRFVSDELVRTYVLHHLQILGEAGTKLTIDLRDRHMEVPWPKVLGMRHVIVHDYFRIDYDIVWGVVQKELPNLKTQLQSILDALEEGL